MARAYVLIKYPGRAERAFDRLHKLATEYQFLLECRTVIEASHFTFGAADIGVIVFAPTWGDIAQAVMTIRARLDEQYKDDLSPNRIVKEGESGAEELAPTLTSTLVGLGREFIWQPEIATKRSVDRLIEIAKTSGLPSEQVALEALGREYFAERLTLFVELLKVLKQSGKVLTDVKEEELGVLEKLRDRLSK